MAAPAVTNLTAPIHQLPALALVDRHRAITHRAREHRNPLYRADEAAAIVTELDQRGEQRIAKALDAERTASLAMLTAAGDGTHYLRTRRRHDRAQRLTRRLRQELAGTPPRPRASGPNRWDRP